MTLPSVNLQGHVALVTGANHGIGAATARTLAACGAAVVVSYLRIPDPGDGDVPELYRRNRAMDAEQVLIAIGEQGGRAVAVEADLTQPGTSARLFDAAESAFGPVDILINNATGWVADTFWVTPAGRFRYQRVRVSVETIDAQFAVDARGSALLIAEFARRQPAFRTKCPTGRRRPRSRTTRCPRRSNSRLWESQQMWCSHR
jgi:3-oxoacyl-[acyl-carrier protein] reductase